MRLAVLVEPDGIGMELRPLPTPAPGDVLVPVSIEQNREAMDSDRTPGSVKTVVAVS